VTDRRHFILCSAAGAILASVPVRAQTAGKMRRIGWLSPGPRPSEAEIQRDWAPLRQLGWIEGKNYTVEWKYLESREALAAAAQELVRLKVDVIVTDGTPAALAAKQATTSIPIVMWSAGDPIALGLAESLAHPGGNITGYSQVSTEVIPKRAALLHELLPKVQRVALPIFPGNPISRLSVEQAEAAYRSLGVRTIVLDPEAVESFIVGAVRQGAEAVDVPSFGPDTPLLIERAMLYRLPVMSSSRDVVDAGGLAAFNIDSDEARERVARIIDKVLRGANPADIPIEQPTRFWLIINMKSAQALGITVPRSILLQANEVIR
jgi:putative tryptophan/tyrosine transport system substrate-binding protein